MAGRIYEKGLGSYLMNPAYSLISMISIPLRGRVRYILRVFIRFII